MSKSFDGTLIDLFNLNIWNSVDNIKSQAHFTVCLFINFKNEELLAEVVVFNQEIIA